MICTLTRSLYPFHITLPSLTHQATLAFEFQGVKLFLAEQ